MPISSTGVATAAKALNTLDGQETGVVRQSDGKKFTVSSTQIVTTLTLTPAGSDTIANNVVVFAAGGAFTFVARSGVWYRG